MTMRIFFYCCMVMLLGSCVSSRNWKTEKKYSPDQLKNDFTVFRNVLEELHPSLYWFTPKDSIDRYFDITYNKLNDSMTERQFRNHLNYMTNKFHCGHTSTYYSKKFTKYIRKSKLPAFPFSMKVWQDTALVTATLLKETGEIFRGAQITAINGKPMKEILDTILQHTNLDGYAKTGQYQFLSNRGNFGSMYNNLFGLTDTIAFEYLDRYGIKKVENLPAFVAKKDTTKTKDTVKERPERFLDPEKSLQIDTTLSSAYMSLNSFNRNEGMTKFFRKSFRLMRKEKVKNLVVDLRSNGGGDAGLSTLLTRYVIDKPFKVADSLYALKRSSRNRKYIQHQWAYWLFTTIVTHKKADGKFHLGLYERHLFKPKEKLHFDGQVYILTGGNTFSAATLFAQKLKGQKNVTIVGEETGGGAYGNTAWMIPEVKLPNTGVRFRLPKFRLVMDASKAAEGRGVMPDIYAAPSVMDVRNGIDVKLGKVRELVTRQKDPKGGAE